MSQVDWVRPCIIQPRAYFSILHSFHNLSYSESNNPMPRTIPISSCIFYLTELPYEIRHRLDLILYGLRQEDFGWNPAKTGDSRECSRHVYSSILTLEHHAMLSAIYINCTQYDLKWSLRWTCCPISLGAMTDIYMPLNSIDLAFVVNYAKQDCQTVTKYARQRSDTCKKSFCSY